MLKLRLLLILRSCFPHTFNWKIRGENPPYPPRMKRRYLASSSLVQGVWIETGTYLGETTKYLSRKGRAIVSIEPQLLLFKFNQKRFRTKSRITLLLGTSEEKLIEAIELADSDHINFWLDGHNSGGITFASEKSPIIFELETILAKCSKGKKFHIFLDDFRLFRQHNGGDIMYPLRNDVLMWIIRNRLSWDVEKDILSIWN